MGLNCGRHELTASLQKHSSKEQPKLPPSRPSPPPRSDVCHYPHASPLSTSVRDTLEPRSQQVPQPCVQLNATDALGQPCAPITGTCSHTAQSLRIVPKKSTPQFCFRQCTAFNVFIGILLGPQLFCDRPLRFEWVETAADMNRQQTETPARNSQNCHPRTASRSPSPTPRARAPTEPTQRAKNSTIGKLTLRAVDSMP